LFRRFFFLAVCAVDAVLRRSEQKAIFVARISLGAIRGSVGSLEPWIASKLAPTGAGSKASFRANLRSGNKVMFINVIF
jgi:hypothetical protein